MENDKLIINLAPTGMVPMKADNARVPLTPSEIAEDCHRCCQLGASILHLHARDEEGKPTWKPDTYRRVIAAVKERCPEAIICVSTSGRNFGAFEQRSAVLDLTGDEKPEMASLTLGSLNFPNQASVNEPAMIQALARKMADNGIMPELEVFDLGMTDYAKFLIHREILRPPFYFNLLLGSLGMLSATPFHLATCVMALPPQTTWAGAGIGRFQFNVNALAIVSGGHVRVGLEDNLYHDAQKIRPADNPALVQRLATLAQAAGRQIATPAEARRMIGLPPIATGATNIWTEAPTASS
jgi:uncharacterized protein (DUF849 family)